MDPNYFSRHTENSSTKDATGRPRWTEVHRVEVRLTGGVVFQHFADLDGRAGEPERLIERMRAAGVHERSSEEMIASPHWTVADNSLWVDSNHSGRAGGGRYAYTAMAATRSELEAWSENLYRNFHPMGYGTFVHQIVEHDDGTFSCTATRAGSCD